MKPHGILGTIFIATFLVAGCNNSNNGSGSNSGVSGKAIIAVPNVGATTNFSFDISAVDTVKGRYYFTDRNNQSVDVFDIKTNTFIKMIKGGFAGCDTGPTCAGANNDKSGPDGLNIIPGTTLIYVGDVNSVKIIDTQTDTVVNTIAIGGNSGLRADEGCYDPDHKIFMINSPGESPPFATFIDTTTQKIIATVLWTDPGTGPTGPASAGLEACVYDHASGASTTTTTARQPTRTERSMSSRCPSFTGSRDAGQPGDAYAPCSDRWQSDSRFSRSATATRPESTWAQALTWASCAGKERRTRC